MKFRLIVIAYLACALLLLAAPLYIVHAQGIVDYKVQVNVDGSVAWTIIQGSNANTTIDTWLGFQERVTNLVVEATIQTQRNMSIDPESFQLTIQEANVEYQFTWLNFSTIQNGKIVLGDAFGFSDFFDQLYGNGIVEITYPSTFLVQSVSPTPNQRDDSQQTLRWLGTQDFLNGNPSILLEPSIATLSPTPKQTSNGIGIEVYLLIGISVSAAIASLLGVYALKQRKKKQTVSMKMNPATEPLIQSEEEKVLKVVRNKGGSAYQSAINDECKFSKAKTSQLLAALEKKGIVRRYKKGRDKIVILTETNKGEQT